VTKILVADDEPMLLQIIVEALTDEGYDVIAARDGQEAVDLTVRENPDLLILDVMMPRLDGREAIRVLRQHNPPPQIPMVLMSAGVSASRVAHDITFLPKPFDLDRLLTLVECLLQRKTG
jgi:DNA-binding response OmpR family regulator